MNQSRNNNAENIKNIELAEAHTNQKEIINNLINILQRFMPKTLAKRIICVILISFMYSIARISNLVNFSEPTVRKIKKAIDSNHIDTYIGNDKKGCGRKSKLEPFTDAIIAEVYTNNYHTLKQIVAMIEAKFNVKTSVSAVYRFLKKHGIKRLKCGSLPAKANIEEQRYFYENTLHPLEEEAKSGKIALFFLDTAHFVMGGDFLGYIYSNVRRFFKTFSGRLRYNVLGCLDIVTKNVITVTNKTYITATTVCELLNKIAEEYVGMTVYIILDNARYQKCKLVQDLADNLGIKLIYIPPYSPNLNFIERFWKYVKNKLRTKYFDDFSKFSNYIDLIIKNSYTCNKDEIDSLINEKVQLFDDLIPINETAFISKKDIK